MDIHYVEHIFVLEEFEDTKGVIRIRISKKNRQHNGQKKKYKSTNNDLQNITHKTKDRVTRIPQSYDTMTSQVSSFPKTQEITWSLSFQKNGLLNAFDY